MKRNRIRRKSEAREEVYYSPLGGRSRPSVSKPQGGEVCAQDHVRTE